MLLPLQLFSSIKLKVLGVRVVILLSPLKEITINFISDVAVPNSAPQDFFLVLTTMIKLMDAILQNLQV